MDWEQDCDKWTEMANMRSGTREPGLGTRQIYDIWKKRRTWSGNEANTCMRPDTGEPGLGMSSVA